MKLNDLARPESPEKLSLSSRVAMQRLEEPLRRALGAGYEVWFDDRNPPKLYVKRDKSSSHGVFLVTEGASLRLIFTNSSGQNWVHYFDLTEAFEKVVHAAAEHLKSLPWQTHRW